MSDEGCWPTERNPDRKDRLKYYAEQRRLRKIEQEESLTDFDKAALCEWAKRIYAPILSTEKEMK